MTGIGAELPPHLLAKRKRQQEEKSPDARPVGPSLMGPLPPPKEEDEVQEKRRRVAGPAPPPAPLEQMPARPAESGPEQTETDESDSDDDFGPAAPNTSGDQEGSGEAMKASGNSRDEDVADETDPEPKLKRDEWMTMPPTQDDLAARLDPTRARPRAFNTGKGARGPKEGADGGSSWHETPEQKQKRLRDEMMGVATQTSAATAAPTVERKKNENLKAKLDQDRGPSLLDLHKQGKAPAEIEDDPSKRAFDREKDMGSGARISEAQKRQMLNKAADFSSRFSGGSYL